MRIDTAIYCIAGTAYNRFLSFCNHIYIWCALPPALALCSKTPFGFRLGTAILSPNLFAKSSHEKNNNKQTEWMNDYTSKTIVFVSMGWQETKLLLQHPPQRFTRVHDGNTTIVGSLLSELSASLRGIVCISGIQFAGTGRCPRDRSTSSPPKRAKKQRNKNIWLKSFILSSI